MKEQYEDIIVNQPVVIDNGTGFIKSGIAGEDVPALDFPTIVGTLKHKRVMTGAIEGDFFVGNKAEQHRGLLALRRPLRHGIVENWNDMEQIWQYVYSELKLQAEDHPVLLTEAPLNPRRNREKSAEMFFETFSVPAFYVSVQAILALYASGRTTGVVLDVGDGVSHTVPVFEGFSLSHAIGRSDLAGRDVTEYLAAQLRRSGYVFHTSAEMEIVRNIKEHACYVAFNPSREEQQEQEKTQLSGGGFPYKLPDGTQISIGAERFRSPEALFKPEVLGQEYPGVNELLLSSIHKSELDLRMTLFQHILLSGGSTMFSGFSDRLLHEIRKIAPKDVKIRISSPPDRKKTTWVGGSILASLAAFKKLWITKQQFEEEGPSVVHRRTF
eukprot:GHVP01068485.1.p2 GENE.GHVP01068485.1~~GHVP01068485.1.p2  ORF type:complete len:384 (-),score=82.45 GHVP01068485.1:1608-2759(-)